MTTDFPSSIDVLTNPTSTDTTTAVDHAGQHSNANDAIEALETKVGVDSSADTNSLDYRVTALEATGTGDVVGPASSTDDNLATFDSTTGKLIQDSGVNISDVTSNTSARHDAVTVTDTAEIDFTLTGQDIQASIKSGSIDETKLDTSVNDSLNLADSSVQTETDPVVGAITGIVKADGGGNISVAVADTDYLTPGTAASTYQPVDTDLTAIAGLSSSDSNIIVGSATGWVAESGATARTSLGVDAAGTDNSTDVTLAGTPDYITITGQEITRNQIDLTTDVTGNLPTSNVADLSGTNTGDQTLTETSKSLTVELPTASEDISMFFTSEAMTITKMAAVFTAGGGSESVTWTVRHSTDRSATGNEVVTSGTTTTSLTTGSIVTSFNDATVPANSYVWFETTAMANDPASFNLTIIYDKD